MASRPGQKTAVFDSVVYAMFNGGYPHAFMAGTRWFMRRVPVCFYGGYPLIYIILLFIVLEAVTFMVLYQNHGNTFGNFINVTASNILNFKIKKINKPNWYPL